MKSRSMDVLLRVRSIRERTALGVLGERQLVVSTINHDIETVGQSLVNSTLAGRRTTEQAQITFAQRAGTAARLSMLADSLALATVDAEEARLAWLAADRDREVAQRLVDRHRDMALKEFDYRERREMDDLSVARHHSPNSPDSSHHDE